MTVLWISVSLHILAGLVLIGASLHGVRDTKRKQDILEAAYREKFNELKGYKERYVQAIREAQQEQFNTIMRRGHGDDGEEQYA